MEVLEHTFVIMAYKESPYLDACIDSLKKQTIKSNIYIATSTPSDHITQIAIRHGIKVLTTTTGQGIGHDYNFGLSTATTKYITLAHQDDIYFPGYAEKCLAAVERYPDTLICFPLYGELVKEGIRKKNFLFFLKKILIRIAMPFKNNLKSRFGKKLLLSFGNPISCPGVMYNKETLPDFSFPQDLAMNLDWDAWLGLVKKKGRFVYVPVQLFYHRIHSGSTTSASTGSKVRAKEDYLLFSKVWPRPVAWVFTKIYALSYRSNKE